MDYLKNILLKLYAKLVPRRKIIRKAINDCLFSLIHEENKLNGIAELLDIMSYIISGFAVPLREEHVQFFINTIIPLHKVYAPLYLYSLHKCTLLYSSKDKYLTIPLL